MNRIAVVSGVALLAGAACLCLADDDAAKDTQIRLLQAENRLLKRKVADLEAQVQSLQERGPGAGGRPGSATTQATGGEESVRMTFPLYESSPDWWTDAGLFARELLLRRSNLVLVRYPDEDATNWLQRHKMFEGQPLEWVLGLFEYKEINEADAGKDYYRNLSNLERARKTLERYEAQSPRTSAVKARIESEQEKVRRYEGKDLVLKRLMETKGGVEMTSVHREFMTDDYHDVFYVTLILPTSEMARVTGYDAKKTKENPKLHATKRIWPVQVSGKVFFWGGGGSQPEIYVDGTWEPAVGR